LARSFVRNDNNHVFENLFWTTDGGTYGKKDRGSDYQNKEYRFNGEDVLSDVKRGKVNIDLPKSQIRYIFKKKSL